MIENELSLKTIRELYNPTDFIDFTKKKFGSLRFYDGACGVLSTALDKIWGSKNRNGSVILTEKYGIDEPDIELGYSEEEDETLEDAESYLWRLSSFNGIRHIVWQDENNSFYDINGKYENLNELLEKTDVFFNQTNIHSKDKYSKVFFLSSLPYDKTHDELLISGTKEKDLTAEAIIESFLSDKKIKLNMDLLFNELSKDTEQNFTFENLKNINRIYNEIKEKTNKPIKIIENEIIKKTNFFIETLKEKTIDLVIKNNMMPEFEDKKRLIDLFEFSEKIENSSPNFFNKNELFNFGLSAYYKSSIFDYESITRFFVSTFKDPIIISDFVSFVDDYKIARIDGIIKSQYKEIYNNSNYDVLNSILKNKNYNKITSLANVDNQDLELLSPIKKIDLDINKLENTGKYAILNIILFKKADKQLNNKIFQIDSLDSKPIDKLLIDAINKRKIELSKENKKRIKL